MWLDRDPRFLQHEVMTHPITRRRFGIWAASASVVTGAAAFNAMAGPSRQTAANGTSFDNAPQQAPGFEDLTDEEWASLSRDQWRERLSEKAFRVLRLEDTERAFTSPLNKEHRDGWFACAGCGQVLFSSKMKYNSGTGWPSFTTVIDGRIGTKPDNKLWMQRTEYHCSRCGGHQGHVFDDGPAPTGQRWCNNGVALKFVPASAFS